MPGVPTTLSGLKNRPAGRDREPDAALIGTVNLGDGSRAAGRFELAVRRAVRHVMDQHSQRSASCVLSLLVRILSEGARSGCTLWAPIQVGCNSSGRTRLLPRAGLSRSGASQDPSLLRQ